MGDDAILSALLADIKEALREEVVITVSSFRPDETEKFYQVKAIDFNSLEQLIHQIELSNIVVVAGGGCFNEYDEWRNNNFPTNHQDYNAYCSNISYLCWLNKTPCFICGIGVEPLYSMQAKQHVRLAFKYATAATVRDSGSLAILADFLDPAYSPTLSACPASRIRAKHFVYVDEIRANTHREGKLLIGVSLRHWNYSALRSNENCSWEDWVAADIHKIKNHYDCAFLFIPFQISEEFGQLGNDLPVINRIIAKANILDCSYVWDQPLKPENIAYGLSCCDIVIACRFHSVILAFAAGVPCVALSYSKKVHSVMVDADLEDFSIDLAKGTLGSLYAPVQKMLSALEAFSQKAKNYQETLQNRGEKNIEIIKQLVNKQVNNNKPDPLARIAKSLLLKISQREKLEEELQSTLLELKNCAANSLATLEASATVVNVLKPFIDNMDCPPDLLYYYAFALHQMGEDNDLALHYYEKVLVSGVNQFWVRYNRGMLLYSMGKPELAEIDWAIALTLPCALDEPKNFILLTMPHLARPVNK